MDKDLEKCGCGEHDTCGCGGHDHDHEGCGCGDHDHEGCGCGCGEEESFVVDLEDDNGNVVSCPIVDAFEVEGKEYVLAENAEDGSMYLFRVDGEELVVPDEEEFDRVSAYYQESVGSEE
ncbi:MULTISPECIES: DUF1292 domain-containing protein [Clostridium]|uniref:DUF1292 domain-containing protein n=1 Tax=Clostridium aquiflavi TaxID=3073603 RepID=A0ABU1EE67_9CLOT|nr:MULTISPECIES: DUF1292 domain-containing protein [unclassified Clostridium]MDR5586559.1 DUF1292 domain-containing protein [Clostridium sp. 5N-1]NFG60673.1 DUF1292 domain-containing protein [Clostridium botulinum]NFQ10541.1 DUF1292 domain-containing protein [Clostridium botulinum]